VNTHCTDRLSEYLDGELTGADAATCAAHVAACSECRTVLAELQMVRDFAKGDVEQMPSTDLWPGVLARIGTTSGDATAGANVVAFRTPSPRNGRAYSFTLPQLALAASLLIAVSAGVAYVAAGRALMPATVHENPIQAQAEPLLPASPGVERANFADAQYDQAVSDLEKILVDMRDELDPRTVVVIERNLSAIDQAIREARAALDADPANTFLNSHLVDARRKKLELLRRATMIHSTSGD
jgi:negative regulator of sigma E activity